MIHDSTWLGKTRAMGRMRLVAPLGLLLACMLLAGFTATASASTYEIRGEWAVELTGPKEPTLSGTAIFNKINGGGEFSGGGIFAKGFVKATASGTVAASEASLTIVAEAPGFENITFISPKVAIDTVNNSFSGAGVYYNAKDEPIETGEVKALRLRDYKQIEEQEEKEKKEKEEKEQKEKEEHEARANIRGEWALMLEVGPDKLKGIALITEEATANNEFASKGALFESVMGGSFSGTLKGNEASVTVTSEGDAAMSIPPGSFTSETIAVSSNADPASMSGAGTFTVGGQKETGELTATRVKTYQQVIEREASEREAKEQKEKEAQEAKEKLELQAKEKAEQETKEKREREGREALEKAKIVPVPIVISPPPAPTLMPVLIVAKELAKGVAVNHSRQVTLNISNPNHLSVNGKLDMFTATGPASAKKKITQFGTSSFSVASGGATTVKLKLSSSNYATLIKRKRLRVVVNITTSANGQSTPTKSYGVTLTLAPTATHKH